MKSRNAVRLVALSAVLSVLGAATYAQNKPFEPTVGQAGKDVVWVPTPEALVKTMLDMAKVTPKDVVMDLGSGDGRTVIEASRRGATAIGVEYNPDMVDLAKRNAAAAGVKTATIIQGDLFEADLSKADVITMFLLPTINLKLRPSILELRPGTHIVSNTFNMDDWQPDESKTLENCTSWCTALLWIVPAKVDGAWQLGGNTLTLDQEFQRFTGSLGSNPVSEGRLNGAEISFTANGQRYTGRVSGNTMSGNIAGGGTWKATKR
jgi:SAM-dependent methyltransferase